MRTILFSTLLHYRFRTIVGSKITGRNYSPHTLWTMITKRDILLRGSYFCEKYILYIHLIRNPAGIASQAYDLVVRYPSTITNQLPPNYEIPIGATLTLSCVADGEPKPIITWTRDNGSLPPNGRFVVNTCSQLIK